MNFRIGHGYDVHRLTEGRKLFLGGVEIPHKAGLGIPMPMFCSMRSAMLCSVRLRSVI